MEALHVCGTKGISFYNDCVKVMNTQVIDG